MDSAMDEDPSTARGSIFRVASPLVNGGIDKHIWRTWHVLIRTAVTC
jgi:hypothetical protein